MPTKNQKIAPRKPRTDAQRNRERILEVAKEAFTRSGANASLDDIAKGAGVGAGTLYRHFPTRDALIEAVYRTEVEKVAAAEKKFSERLPPVEALRAFLTSVLVSTGKRNWMEWVRSFAKSRINPAPAMTKTESTQTTSTQPAK